jgi:hypothetical protein
VARYRIAQAYQKYVDEELVEKATAGDLKDWYEDGFNIELAGHADRLRDRWLVLYVYCRNEMERKHTAEAGRDVARRSGQWLYAKLDFRRYLDWTWSAIDHMDPDERVQWNHQAAVIDIEKYLLNWREHTLVILQLFATRCDAVLRKGSMFVSKQERRHYNVVLNILEKEMQGVVHAIKEDHARPRRLKKEVEEEE